MSQDATKHEMTGPSTTGPSATGTSTTGPSTTGPSTAADRPPSDDGLLRDSAAFSGFSVDDVAAAREFYGETLGLEVRTENGMLRVHLGSGAHVLAYPKGEDHSPASYTVLNFPVPDIEHAVDVLTARGVRFERYEAMADDFDDRGIFRGGGPPIAWFTDPAGNVLSILAE